jgi:mannose-6-phosphate isomerase-like protein (cupin superfamily)
MTRTFQTAARVISRRCVTISALLLLAMRVVGAQSASVSAPATVMSADRLRAVGDSLTPAASRTAQLGHGPGYTYAVTHRDSSGGLEVHRDWTDVFVVEAGSATLLTGGVAEGAQETTPGEWRGGTARGATRAPIKGGDVVVIPAGTPHQMLLGPREQITYIAFKVAAPLPATRP